MRVSYQPARIFMGRVIAVANQKGGVGKTTTAVNLAASLAAAEKRTLLVDCDPQGNASSGVGVRRQTVERSLYDAPDRATKLRDALAPIGGRYDYIVLDCPPSLGLLTLNALTAANRVLV